MTYEHSSLSLSLVIREIDSEITLYRASINATYVSERLRIVDGSPKAANFRARLIVVCNAYVIAHGAELTFNPDIFPSRVHKFKLVFNINEYNKFVKQSL